MYIIDDCGLIFFKKIDIISGWLVKIFKTRSNSYPILILFLYLIVYELNIYFYFIYKYFSFINGFSIEFL
jgi:hypothetical protein